MPWPSCMQSALSTPLPNTIHATLLDEGQYPCSVRTLYRILTAEDERRERRHVRRHPQYAKPERLATGPNQLWSWDITKLKGPAKWTYFYRYVIIDVFSRYVVGWMVATCASAALAKQFISATCAKQSICPGQLTLHADRGSRMKSKPVALLLTDLGVTKTHSRPYTSDDNPFSEAHFKTLKYRPTFPECFGAIADARAHCQIFFPWYNDAQRHSGIAFMTPANVHYERVPAIMAVRAQTLNAAFAANPLRFKGKLPIPKLPPVEVWINPPTVGSTKPPEPPEQH
jgi:putative transposase